MSDVVTDIQNVCVDYGGAVALEDVSLQVRAGESIALLGSNGAGKTTLLTTVNGFTPLTSGIIRVLGLSPYGCDVLEVRRRVAYIAQSQQVEPRMPITLRESVMTGLYGKLGWRRRISAKTHAAVDEILEHLNIASLAARPLGRLSGGELRRAAIARALVQDPEILLLDEPTASLDDQSRRDICALMGELNRERGVTLLWVTHDLDALPDTCTRALRMKQGRIVQDVSPPTHAFPFASSLNASGLTAACYTSDN